MRHSAKLFALTALAGLGACAHKPPRPFVPRTVSSAEGTISFQCQRSNGDFITQTISLSQIRDDSRVYRNTLKLAEASKAKVMDGSFTPFGFKVPRGWDTLEVSYWPYIDPDTNLLHLRGNITCGHPEGRIVENLETYATGVIRAPFDFPALEQMTTPYRIDGVGGYRATIVVNGVTNTRPANR